MEKKRIEDYLHLYGIDCPIMTPDGLGSVLVIYPKAVEVSLNLIQYQQQMKGRKGGGEMHYKYFYPEVKPILRPLYLMTADEETEYKDLFLEHPDCYEKTRWLLSKGFDLFNLIPEGLALDSTQQPLTQVNK